MTNLEYLKSLSDEEFAVELANLCSGHIMAISNAKTRRRIFKAWRRWLMSEHADEGFEDCDANCECCENNENCSYKYVSEN